MAYTEAQEARLTNMGTITFADAEALAGEFGVSTKSVIAKIHSLNAQADAGITYVPKARPAKRPKGVTKAELVDRIADATGAFREDIDGLTKAPARALSALLDVVG